MDELFLNRLNG